MSVEELAVQVLNLLKLQKEYFQTRSPTKLAECRDAERRMARICNEIVNPPQPTMFE